jgi:hypothetical protein
MRTFAKIAVVVAFVSVIVWFGHHTHPHNTYGHHTMQVDKPHLLRV